MLAFNQLSYWEKESYLKHVDFLIIGSGIVGLSTAIHLKKAKPNKNVLVLERGYLPSGASTKNAGFACIGSASEILDDINNNSEHEVFETIEKRWQGLVYLRELLGVVSIEYLELGSHELFKPNEKAIFNHSIEQIEWLNQHLKRITGIEQNFQVANSYCEKSGFYGFNKAISNKAEGQLNTGKMMQRLVQLAIGLGIQILNGIEVKTIENHEIISNYGKISFDKLAICVNGFAKQFLPNEDVKPARAQVVITSPIPDLKVRGIHHFDKGYYYFRNIGNRVLFGGGRNLDFEGEETDELNTSDKIINHLSYLLESQILPNSSFTIEQHWAGTMGVGKTKKPIIKQLEKNIYCGVRLGGMGVAIGSLVGKDLADLIITHST
ncbi:MAG: FAD-binding oxidoreductase [Bacteroidetes bacterium]|nr:MAG: FAD-binding oxidoreductase [Bacteroidota bacterium]MBL1144228.1 FAD-binding oxidoreductase [Bacteroidota bacterium]MCB0802690.1 FAD-binding oxidoreductase [Flavobacteriales bacterium]NOG57024.1 FAD-binding oxidoreductase [Bacteroidota bacterium]